ncbi:uncharacterized protein [Apostichopus japonicus]|uniref:uncharacterized protein isoform X5 n=1 Tax=Stichopus japonicus TaxID=307972 RepID=UPI003AB21F1C
MMRLLLLLALAGLAYTNRVSEPRTYSITTPNEYYWFPTALPSRPCTIHFQIKASRDAVISFSPEKQIVQDIYEIVIGAEGNLFLCIRRGNGEAPILDQLAFDILTGEWQDFWVELCNGVVIVEGLDENAERVQLARWQDDEPYTANQWYVGLTSMVEGSEWRFVDAESCGIDGEDNDIEEREERERENNNRRDRQRDEATRLQDEREREARERRRRLREERQRSSGSGSSSNTRPGSGSRNSNGPRRGSGSGSSSNTGPRSGTSDSNGPRRGSGSGSSSNTGPRSRTSNSNGPRRGSGSGSSSNTGPRSGTSVSNGPRRGSGSGSSSNTGRGSGTRNSNGPRRGSGSVDSSNSRRRGSGTSRSNDRARNAQPAPRPDNGDKIEKDIQGNFPAEWTFIEWKLRNPSGFKIPFWLKAEGDAYIRLSATNADSATNFYTIMIGFRSNRNVCIMRSGRNVVDEPIRGVLDRDDFVYFELEWDGRTIKLWKEGQLLVEYTDRDPYSGLDWIGFTSYDSVNPSNRIPSRWKFERNSFGSGSGSSSNTGPRSGTSNSNGPRRGSGSGSNSNTGPGSGTSNSNGPRRGSGSGSSSNTGPRSGSRNSNGPRRGSGSGSSSNTGPRSGTSVSNGPRRGSGSGSSSNTGRGSGTRNSNGPRRGSGSGSSSNTGRGSGTRNSNGPRRGSGSVDSSNSRRRGSGTSRSNDRARNAQPAPRPDNGDIIEKDIQGNFPAEWTFIEWKLRNPSGFKIPFWLKAEGDAYIRLSATNADSATNFYTIMIGFRSNRNVCIMRSGRNVVDEPIRGVLDRDDFVYFELEWDGRTIKLWKEGQLLVEYTDRDPYSGLDWIGFTSYDSVNPSNRIPSRWKFERNSFVSLSRTYSIATPNEYYWFPTALPSRPCTIHFQIKASRDAVISFSPEKQIVQDIYEIVFGAEGNLFLCIRRGNGVAPILDQLAFDILTGEWQDFWVELCNGVVIVEGLDENAERVQLARWEDDDPYTADQWFVGVTSMVEGSEWRVVDAESCGIDGEDNDIEERQERERENNNRRLRQRDEATRLQAERQQEARERRQRLREERQRSSGSGSSSNTGRGSGSSNSNGRRRGSGSGSSSNSGPGSGTSNSNGRRRGSGSGSSSNTGPGSETIDSNGPGRDNGDKIEKEIRGNSPAEWTFIEGKLLNPSRFKITFWLKAEGDAHIRLSATNNDNSNAYYEIMIGFRNNNNVCIVRSGRSVVDDPIPGVLSRELFIEFELEWDGRSIKLWKGGRVLVEYTDRDPCRGLDWIGFTSYDSINPSNRIPSRWKFEKNSFAISGAGAGGGGGGGGERWRGSSRSRSSRRGSSGSRRGSRRSGGRRRGSSSSS